MNSFRSPNKRRPENAADGRWQLALFLLLLGTVAITWRAYAGYVFEDAYITLRYSQNLASGHGFVFNPGERVLGTTSPLWAALLAIPGMLGLPIDGAAGFLFVVSWAAAAAIGAISLCRFGGPLWGLAFAALMMSGFANINSFWGMETAFCLACLLAAWAAANADRAGTAGVLMAVAGLTRYDAVVAAFFLGVLLWRKSKRFPWRFVWAGLLVVSPWVLFSTLFFGSVLPATLGAKSGDVSFFPYLAASLRYQIDGWGPTASSRSVIEKAIGPVFWLLPTIAWVLSAGAVISARHLFSRATALRAFPMLTAIGLWLAYGAIGPPAEHRWHLVPASGLWLLAGLIGWSSLPWRWPWGRRNPGSVPVRSSGLVATFVVVGVVLCAVQQPHEALGLRRAGQTVGRAPAYSAMVDWMGRNELRSSTVMTLEPGYFAFISKSRMIDLAGLVTLGLRFHHVRSDMMEAIARFQPDFVVDNPGRRPGSQTISEFRVAYEAFPAQGLLVSERVWEREFEAISGRWLQSSEVEPCLPAAPLDWNLVEGFREQLWRRGGRWTGLGGAAGHDPQTPLATSRWGSPWEGGETPEFCIGFDALHLSFVANLAGTAVELVIDGQPVLQESASLRQPDARREVVWPVATWKGRRATVRYVDVAPIGGFVEAGFVRSIDFVDSVLLDDFEDDSEVDRGAEVQAEGQTAFGVASGRETKGRTSWGRGGLQAWVTDLHPLARTLGLAVLTSNRAVHTVGRPGEATAESASFLLPRDAISFLFLDRCSAACGVELVVNGRTRRRLSGTDTGRWRGVVWGTERWRGRPALLRLVDGDPRPEGAVGLDDLRAFNRSAGVDNTLGGNTEDNTEGEIGEASTPAPDELHP